MSESPVAVNVAAAPSRTVRAGAARPSAAAHREPASERAGPAVSPLRPQLFVTILEAADDGLLIRWVESGRCHYGEQRWRLRIAPQPGRCAISGRPIAPGERVYRPVLRPAPLNGDEMICPASVPCAAPSGVTAGSGPDAAQAGPAAYGSPGVRD